MEAFGEEGNGSPHGEIALRCQGQAGNLSTGASNDSSVLLLFLTS